MKITTYVPLDLEHYLLEEHILDTNTGKKEFTGRKYRKRSESVPADSEAFKVLQHEMKSGMAKIFYSPVDFKPYPYDLIFEE